MMRPILLPFIEKGDQDSGPGTHTSCSLLSKGFREWRTLTTGPTLLNGREVGAKLLEECRIRSIRLAGSFGDVPQLVVVLVGHDPASGIDVRAKEPCLPPSRRAVARCAHGRLVHDGAGRGDGRFAGQR